MPDLVRLDEYPVKDMLGELLLDKATGENIIFATDAYMGTTPSMSGQGRMTATLLLGFSAGVQPRVNKTASEQSARTRKKAEVFTPTWIVNKMVNELDGEWFGQGGAFNSETGESWQTFGGKVIFPMGQTWQDYVNLRWLEITCGEAPYLASRYDSATGEGIALAERVGILDRKLRVIGENAASEDEWLAWVYRAYQNVYGYEFQGDSLLIARINLLVTFVDYMQDRWGRQPTDEELAAVTEIICWNVWQMDGLTGAVPFAEPSPKMGSLFDDDDSSSDCQL